MTLPLLLLPALALGSPQDIWVRAPTQQARAQLRRPDLGFAEGSSGDWIRLHADPSGLAAINAAGLDWHPAPPPPPGFPAGYRTPAQAVDLLTELAASDLAERVDLGESRWGQPIVGLRITASTHPAGQWRVLGAHHGDELPGGEVALAFASHLIEGYGVDEALTALLDRDAVWVVPHVNPDGLSQISRYNAIGVDLNRNYGYQWTEDAYRPGEAPFSEPETRAVRGLSSWNPFQAGLSLHAGASNLGWVWNHTTEHSPDASLVERMAESYDALCTAPGFWITPGAEWYITYGDTTDWSYGRRGMLEFTLELSTDKTPDYSEIEGIIDDHLPAMREFLLWPHRLTGQVIDASTGRPIPAAITRSSGQPLVTGLDGRFALSVSHAGSHSVAVDAQGYTSTAPILQTGSEPVLIELTPTSLGTARPDPAILSQGGDGTFALEGESVWLHRPGEVSVAAESLGSGQWWVDLSALMPGAWDVEADGLVTPRGLFIGEVDSRVRITGSSIAGDTLTVSGGGFGYGSAAFALWGVDRAPVQLPTRRLDEDTIEVDIAALADVVEPVDLALWSRGYQLAVHDALGIGGVDADPPDVEEPVAEDGLDSGPHNDPPAPDGGCASTGGRTVGLGLLALAGAALARRRRPTA